MSGNAFSVDQLIDPTKVVADMAINDNELNAEFVRQPGLIYYYASLQAKAERQHSELKLRLEAQEAHAATEVRKQALADGEKLTADMVKERVRLNPKVVKIEQLLIASKEVFDTVKAAVEGMRHKRDMLVIRGHTSRDEMRAGIEVRDSLAHHDYRGVADRDAAIKQRLGANA